MSVISTDIKFYAASSMPQDNTTLSGGAIDTATRVVFTDIAATDNLTVLSSLAGDNSQTLTITGRDGTGAIITEGLSLNGTSRVTGVSNFERILKLVCSPAHNGTLTITRDDGPTFTSIATMESGVNTIRRLYYDSSADASGGADRDYYEKIFVKNTNSTTALSNATVKEQSDPTAKITFDMELTKSGTNSTTNRLTLPASNMQSSFSSSDHYILGSSLGPGEFQGCWLKLTLVAGSSPVKSTWTVRLSGTTT